MRSRCGSLRRRAEGAALSADVIRQLLVLASTCPPELSGTAGTLRLAAMGLEYQRETPADSAAHLRAFAEASRVLAADPRHLPTVAVFFALRADILDRGAEILAPTCAAAPAAEVR